ncbi:MAG: 50S ribosomal protein L25, partial [Planctomycetota bacterium]
VLQQTAAEVTIECAVRAIPEEITVMVTEMKVGDRLTMGDLPLPEGSKLLGVPETAIASIRVVVEEVVEEEEEVTEEAPAAEPEVIGEAKEEEDQTAGEG